MLDYNYIKYSLLYSQNYLISFNDKVMFPKYTEKLEKIKQYISKWGLEKCTDKYPNELSGGQRQRTAIIEQLFSSDKFIVMDEPFSGLDVGNIWFNVALEVMIVSYVSQKDNNVCSDAVETFCQEGFL